MAKIKVLVDVDVKGEGEIKKTTSSLDEMGDSSKTAGTKLSSLKSAASGLGVGLVAAGAVVKTFKTQVLDVGASIETASNTFSNLSASIGTTSDAMLSELRPATRGMVSDFDLMTANNRFMSMGLATSATEAAKLSEVATQLGTAMGKDAGDAMEEFALLMANQSIPRLDTFGISAGKVRERIAELTTGVNAMDSETAFMTATMEQAELTMAKVGEQGADTASSMARLSTAFSNVVDPAKQKIAERWEPIFGGLANVIDTLGERSERLDNAIADGFITQEQYNIAIRDSTMAGMSLVAAQDAALEGYIEMNQTIPEVVFNATSLEQQLLLVTDAMTEQAEVSGLVTERTDLFATVTGNITALMNSEEAQIVRLNDAFGGTISQTETATATVSTLFDGIASLPDTKEIRVNVSVSGFNAVAAFLGGGGVFGEVDYNPETGDVPTPSEQASGDEFDQSVGGGGTTIINNFDNADSPAQIAGQIANQLGGNIN